MRPIIPKILALCLGPWMVGEIHLEAQPGSLDQGFRPHINGRVNHTALDSEGKILIAGEFTMVEGVARQYLARLNPNGTLDASFDPGTWCPSPALQVLPHQNPLSSDIFVNVGDTFLKFSKDGFPAWIQRSPLDPVRFYIPTFLNGIFPQVRRIAFGSGGSLYAVGSFTDIADRSQLQTLPFTFIGKFNDQGMGVPFFQPPFEEEFAAESGINDVAILPDGSMAVAGHMHLRDPPSSFNESSIVRLQSDRGRLDTNFVTLLCTNRLLYYACDFQDSVAALPSGHVLVSDILGRTFKLDQAGHVDPAFTRVSYGVNESFTGGSIIPLENGMFHVTGSVRQGDRTLEMPRFFEDGTLDESFVVSFGECCNFAKHITPLPDAKLLISGNFTTVNGIPQAYLARLNSRSPIHVTSIARTANEDVRLEALGESDRYYAAEHSETTFDWIPFATNLSSSTGHIVFTDTITPAIKQRFYRMRYVGPP